MADMFFHPDISSGDSFQSSCLDYPSNLQESGCQRIQNHQGWRFLDGLVWKGNQEMPSAKERNQLAFPANFKQVSRRFEYEVFAWILISTAAKFPIPVRFWQRNWTACYLREWVRSSVLPPELCSLWIGKQNTTSKVYAKLIALSQRSRKVRYITLLFLIPIVTLMTLDFTCTRGLQFGTSATSYCTVALVVLMADQTWFLAFRSWPWKPSYASNLVKIHMWIVFPVYVVGRRSAIILSDSWTFCRG